MNLPSKKPGKRILIDAREFVPGRRTGIGRVLEGLSAAMAASTFSWELVMAGFRSDLVPSRLRSKSNVRFLQIPEGFLRSETVLSRLSRGDFDLFVSPYPKLPLWGTHCPCGHIVHDVLDLTHPLYRRRFKVLFDRYRLKNALRRADITWYDSSWSMDETQKHFGLCGRNPRVRYPGIDKAFQPQRQSDEATILEGYGLKPGFVLALGNGLPHKNLGILLTIASQIQRAVVFAGVPDNNRQYWESRHRGVQSKWISHVEDQHLPALMRAAFCLVQPSLVEGYGYPPLEAMACGIPAVVSDIPVLVETTGGHALRADPLDSRAWMNALSALENASFYCDAANKGLEWVARLRGAQAWEAYVRDIQYLFTKGGV